MEADDEIKGSGNSYDFGSRMLDPRLGRWLTIDPSHSVFPNESPYVAYGNCPIFMKDAHGGFKIPNHNAITQAALKNVRASLGALSEADLMYGATVGADIDGAFSDYHFDGRKNYNACVDNWKRLYGIIDKLSDDIGPFNKTWGGNDMGKLGTTVHNVQDFYAHSNYVELYIEYYKDTHDGAVPTVSEIPNFIEGKK